MTFFVALWVLDQERKAWDYATDESHDVHIVNPMKDEDYPEDKKAALFSSAVLAGIAQSTFLGVTGHVQLSQLGMRMERYGKFSHRWQHPKKWYQLPKILPKNKWALRGAKLGGKLVPGLNVALLAYDAYSVGKYLDVW